MSINGQAATDPYEAYFHIPVPYRDQTVLSVEVSSPQLIDFRYVRMGDPNVMVAARLHPAAVTYLDWTAYVLVDENTYADLPPNVPIPQPEDLPDSVKVWLGTSDCVQLDAPIVQDTARRVRGATTNLIDLAEDICAYCDSIPWDLPHMPMAFDAVYALTWGNSCTGHAHAAAALLRANGVPARVLLNIPTWYSTWFDMHWCVDYFVPGYGWVRMEPSLGQHPYEPQNELVTFACNLEDEFPLYLPCGIEGDWHTSDPALGTLNPNWSGAHRGYSMNSIAATAERIAHAHALTDATFSYEVLYHGVPLGQADQLHLSTAEARVLAARGAFIGGDFDGFLTAMAEAIAEYERISPASSVAIYAEDFESAPGGWTHGGTSDEWEWGPPMDVPQGAHSGISCWGMDLDGPYENNADCWLLGPPVDLNGLVAPTLSFHVWNWVQDRNQGTVYDPLWVEISRDGVTFEPICSQMAGVNDDPAIPDVGGWNRVVLDLSRYAGGPVQARFRFSSNASVAETGSYIDDVRFDGRFIDVTEVPQAEDAMGSRRITAAPNPFGHGTLLEYRAATAASPRLELFDVAGRRICAFTRGNRADGVYRILWDGRDDLGRPVPNGVYVCRSKEVGTLPLRIVRVR